MLTASSVMVIIIIVVAAFKNTTALTNAYGCVICLAIIYYSCEHSCYRFAVATVMLTTTLLISLQFKYVKGLPLALGIAFFFVFGFFDGKFAFHSILNVSSQLRLLSSGLFWGAAVKKIPEGAWVPLMIGLIL